MNNLIKESISIDIENVKQVDTLKPNIFWKYQAWRFLNTVITVLLIVIVGILLILVAFFVWVPIVSMLKMNL